MIRRRPRGFTLIEILVVVGIIGIMLAIAVPSFTSFISNYRATAAVNDFLQATVVTRNEAIKQSRSMTMAPIVAGDWRSGWVIFHDVGAGSCPTKPNAVMDAAELPSRVLQHEALPSSIAVSNASGTGPAFTDTSNTSLVYISYDGTGYPRQYCNNNSMVGAGIVITNTVGSSVSSRTLCLSASGRSRVIQNVYDCKTSGY